MVYTAICNDGSVDLQCDFDTFKRVGMFQLGEWSSQRTTSEVKAYLAACTTPDGKVLLKPFAEVLLA